MIKLTCIVTYREYSAHSGTMDGTVIWHLIMTMMSEGHFFVLCGLLPTQEIADTYLETDVFGSRLAFEGGLGYAYLAIRLGVHDSEGGEYQGRVIECRHGKCEIFLTQFD